MLDSKISKTVYEITPGSTPLVAGYQISFTFFSNDQIRVYLTNGLTQVEVASSNYSIVKNETIYKVVFLADYVFPSDAIRLVIAREVVFQQNTNLINGELIDAEVLERALDLLVAMSQQLKEITERVVLSPISEDTQTIIPEKIDRAGRILGFDDKGEPISILTSDIEQKLSEALRAEKEVIKALDSAAAYAYRSENASEEAYNNRFMTELAKTQALSASITAKENAEISTNKKAEAERILGAVEELERNIRAIRQEVTQLASQVSYDKADVSSNLSDTITAKNIAVQASLGSQDARAQTESIRTSTEAILDSIKDLAQQIASTAASSAPTTTMIINGIQYNVSFYTEGLRTYRKLKRVATA